MDTARRVLATASFGADAEQRACAGGSDDPPFSERVLVVEEHELMATGLQLALSDRHWEVEACTGPTAADVVDHADRFHPGCALLDIRLGKGIGSGIELIGPLVATGTKVVMLTAERRRTVLAACLEAGAAGWINKGSSLDEVDSTLRRLLAGGSVIGPTNRSVLLEALQRERVKQRREQSTFELLTHREKLVLAALTDGLSADEIAREDFVAVTTIRSQIRAVLQKLGVKSQLAAVAVAGVHRELLPQRENSQRDRRQPQLQSQDGGGGPKLSEHIA